MAFSVQHTRFEGPLDLLLYFIQRDEVDIFDIPVARIADDFLSYVRALREVDLNAAGDYVYYAALLTHLKVRMMLPREEDPLLELGQEHLDPRTELVEHIVAYIKAQEAAGLLSDREAERLLHFGKAPEEMAEPIVTEGPWRLSRLDLIKGFKRLLITPPVVQHTINKVVFQVEVQVELMVGLFRRITRLPFARWVQKKPRGLVVARFLAVLETARKGMITLHIRTPHEFDITAEVPETQPQTWN